MLNKILPFLLIFPCLIIAQSTPVSLVLDEASNQKVLQMMDEVIGPIGPSLNFNLSAQEFYENVDDIPEGTNYNDEYLDELLEKYKKDSLNIYTLNNLGNYYSHFEEEDQAKKYFSKALEYIDLEDFEKDSSSYFSFKGSFKFQLNDSTALKDFEKSIQINPKDTLANFLYPLSLMKFSKVEFPLEKLRQLIDELDDDDALNYYFYHAIISSFKQFSSRLQDLNINDAEALLENKDFEEYYNLDEIYYDDQRFKRNKYVKSIKPVMNLLLFSVKDMFWISQQEDIFTSFDVPPSKNEQKNIKKIIKSLEKQRKKGYLNEYLYNRSMSMAYFNLKDFDASEMYAKLAIEEFPFEKQSYSFTADPIFDQIYIIHYLKNDVEKFKNAVELKKEKTNKDSTTDFLVTIAYLSYKKQDFKEAINYCKQALKEDNKNKQALTLLTHIYFLTEMQPLFNLYNDKLYEVIENDEEMIQYFKYSILLYVFEGNFKEAQNRIDVLKEDDIDLEFCIDAEKLIADNQ